MTADIVQATAVSTKGEEIGLATKETLGLSKSAPSKVDLPQDYFSPPAIASPRETKESVGDDDDFAAKAHAWVSPNKSGEVPSSKESSPVESNEKSIDESPASTKDSTSTIKAVLETEYEADFEPVATEEQLDVNLSIVGQSLEVQTTVSTEESAVLDASGNDFIKIIHGGKEAMLVLPSGAGSTLEISETLAATFDIQEEIVGLKTTALLIDDESPLFRSHGDVVIPLSSSSELRRLLKNAQGLEGIPSFEIVTTNFRSFLENYREVSSQGEDDSYVQETALYTEAFVELMEKSDQFDPFEKNALLRFGVDNADQGNVLYRAAYRVAVYTDDMKHFVQGLKAIAKILLDVNALPAIDEDGPVPGTNESAMTVFGLTDFIVCADELFESNDLTAQQYATLLDAIFSGHSAVLSLFDLYHNPDFLLACDSDDDLRGSLCLRDLHHLARQLEPMNPQTQDVELLQWAIKTGIHNFSASMATELPKEFVNVINHMFTSGDEMVLGACQKFVDTNDSDAVETMLLREYDIYCRNSAFRDVEANPDDTTTFSVAAEPSSTNKLQQLESSFVKASDVYEYEEGEFPDVLMTAVACLVDNNDLSEDAAAGILASYAKGNQLLRDVYDHFIDFGDVDDFLDMLKVVASTEPFDTRMMVGASFSSGVEEQVTESENAENAFRSALESMQRDELFGDVEIAALRLAAVRKDRQLTHALADYRAGMIDIAFFKATILTVVGRVIDEFEQEI